MLKRIRPDAIKSTLAVTGQGETIKFDITYFNRKQSEVVEAVAKAQQAAVEEGKSETVADAVLFMVKEWDAEYPLTKEGVLEMEDDRPGLLMAIIMGFHKARQVEVAKN